MFRNIFSKLPGITTLSEFPVSTPCNSRMLRNLPPIKPDHRRKSNRNEITRSMSRRSYSFPSTRPKSYELERTGKIPAFCQNTGLDSKHLSTRNTSKRRSKSKHAESSSHKHVEEEEVNEQAQNASFECYPSSEQYELESSRPRKSQSQIGFNVFEYVESLEKDHDPMAYLQPSNLRPFGSTDNTYIPISNRPSSTTIIQKEIDYIEDDGCRAPKTVKNDGSIQKREYSTKTHQNTSTVESLIRRLPPFEATSESLKSFSQNFTCSEDLKDIEQSENNSVAFSHNSFTDDNYSFKGGYGAPPKRAYSEAMRARIPGLPKGSRSIYGLHLPDETVSLKGMPNRQFNIKYPEKDSDSNIPLTETLESSKYSSLKPVLLCPEPTLLNKKNSPTNNVEDKKSLSSTAVLRNRKFTSRPVGVRSYSNKGDRPFEPESCEKPPGPNKCFLPSKLRLKPPVCTPKPPPCQKADQCPPRADDNAVFKAKPLPRMIAAEDCPCISPIVPSENPKLKRLNFDFKDPPKICAIEGPTCQPRADDALIEQQKRLPRHIPKDCPCIEPPPLKDVPLKRLQKICEPPEVCKPVRVCPEPDPCYRADNGREESSKKLPVMKVPHCPCIISPPQLDIPKMKRLNLHVPEPPRKKQHVCKCDVDCPRADDTWKQLPKKLPKLHPSDCPCVDQKFEDVKPLKRLVCKDEPEECPTKDPCIEVPRADMGCWEYWIPEKRSNIKKKSHNHSSKRKYNTDTRFQNEEEIGSKGEYEIIQEMNKNNFEKSGDEVKISEALSTPTIELLRKLKELEGTGSQTDRRNRHSVLKTNTIQVQNVRNLSSKVKRGNDTKCKKKESSSDDFVQKSDKCSSLGNRCPKFNTNHCPQVRDPCNKSCKHIPPKLVCNKKTPPYPSFSDLLDENLSTFTNTSECKAGEREFDFHLEEKKIGPSKPKHNTNNKCFSTLADPKANRTSQEQSKQIHRCDQEENELSESNINNRNVTAHTEDYRTMKIDTLKNNVTDQPLTDTTNRSDMYHQKSGLGIKKTEKMNLKPQSSPVVQPCRLESNFMNKKGTNFPKDNEKNKKEVGNTKKVAEGDKCKKTSFCPKFHFTNCAPLAKRLPSCRKLHPVICQKQQAPFKAFSDCLQGELAENLSECPLERDKKRMLQPDSVKMLDPSKLMQPIQPRVGKLDLTAEHECVRRKLCLEKQGITESCSCFGKPHKRMRAKDLAKIREQLKNQNDQKHLYHNQTARSCKRKFCTCAFNPMVIQRRQFSNCLNQDALDEDTKQPELEQRRSYHLLCKTKERHIEEDLEEKKYKKPHLSKDYDDSNKSTMRGVQPRVDNFQKWHRLNKLTSHSTVLKKYHSCSDVLREQQRLYSSVVSNSASYHNLEDDISCKHISTSIRKFAKKRSKDPKSQITNNVNKVTNSECTFKCMNIIPECDYRTEQLKSLQPSMTNTSTRTICEPYPDVGVIDYSLSREYMRHRYGMKNEGITQDCNTFGKALTCKDILFRNAVTEAENYPCKETYDTLQECESKIESENVRKPCKSSKLVLSEVVVKPCESSKSVLPDDVVEPVECSKTNLTGVTEKPCEFSKPILAEVVEKPCLSSKPAYSGVKEEICQSHSEIKEEICQLHSEVKEGICQSSRPLPPDDLEKACQISKQGSSEVEQNTCQSSKPAYPEVKETICQSSCPVPPELSEKSCQIYKQASSDVQNTCQDFKPSLPEVIPSDAEKDVCRQRLVFKVPPLESKNDTKRSYSDCDITSGHLKELHRCIPEEKSQTLDRKGPAVACMGKNDSIWRKLVNYFKARPGCPAPDEWKKKALREKAEKAAKAAGLVLCDPKELEKLKNPCVEMLPEVITPRHVNRKNEDKDDPCALRKKNLDGFQRRNFTTSISPSNHLCDPLYIRQYLNKVITVPLDVNQVNLVGCNRFPKMLNCYCNFFLREFHLNSPKKSYSMETKRYYSKCSDRKELEDLVNAKEENEKMNNVDIFGESANVKNGEETDFTEKVTQTVECCKQNKENDTAEPNGSVSDYPNRYCPKKQSIFDLIFPEDMKDNPEYHQAKALAAFQEIFNRFDSYSDMNVEELENLKTQQMLRELDKLLEDTSKSEKK